jgi:L-lactate utilization protein LutB
LKYDDNDIQAITDARNQLLKTFEMHTWETKESEKTKKIHEKVRDHLLSNLDDYISMKKLYDE